MRESIKLKLTQILAIAEKNIKDSLRYKFVLLMSFINPMIQLFLPLIIMNQLFSFQNNFGPWTRETYVIYLIFGYNFLLIQGVISSIVGQFMVEKYWSTLKALMIAPFNRFNLLFGILLTHMIIVSIPFSINLIICYIFLPVSIITIICVLMTFLAILIICAGMGFIIGVFAISNESIARLLQFIIHLALLASCVSYPYEIFPPFIQYFINLNPIYYILDLLRRIWLENNIILTLISHPFHFLILITLILIFPLIGIYSFNFIFKKYGIQGY